MMNTTAKLLEHELGGLAELDKQSCRHTAQAAEFAVGCCEHAATSAATAVQCYDKGDW